MTAAYFYLNAFLYLLFAAWCTVSPQKTATNLGYVSLSAGGQSEYLVIYGGLQLGVAVMFWMLARHPEMHPVGIFFGLALYSPIVVYRIITVAKFWPVRSLTIATGCLETLLLVAAIGLYFARNA